MDYLIHTNLKTLLEVVIGAYNPVQINSNTYIDIPYVIGGVIYILFIYFFLKILFSFTYKR